MGPAEFRAALAVVLAVIVLAGCASSGRSSEGVDIVVWQEQERQKLEAQGFPQYNFD
ncbi:MAG: hypothetical protein ACREVS_10990 [Burkholderiales bacterium]